MAAPVGPDTSDRYPYKTPRWILWIVGVVSVGAVIAAFVVGPKNDSKRAARATTTSVPATATDSVTTEGPTTTTGPTTTAPTSTTTAPPTTATTTAPPTTAPPALPPASGTVAVTSCRIEGTTVVATGTLTNTGPAARRFRATAVGIDGAGNKVVELAVELDSVAPGATAPFTARLGVDGTTSSRISTCRSGPATPL